MDIERAWEVAAGGGDCFLCRWILDDLLMNGKLTGYPLDHTGAPQFPIYGKVTHLELEAAHLDIRI